MKKAMELQNLSSLYFLLLYFTLYCGICLLMYDGGISRVTHVHVFNLIVMKGLEKDGGRWDMHRGRQFLFKSI